MLRNIHRWTYGNNVATNNALSMMRRPFRNSELPCLWVSSGYESITAFCLSSPEDILRKRHSLQECTKTTLLISEPHLVPDLKQHRLHWYFNRLPEIKSTTLNASLVWAVKCSLETETPTRSSNAPHSTGEFIGKSSLLNLMRVES